MPARFPRRLLTDDETIVVEFHAHWRTLLVIPLLLAVAVAATLVVPDILGLRGELLVILWAAVAMFCAAHVLTWWSTQYVLTTERLIWRFGVLRRGGVEIPLEQLHTVKFSQSLLERILRYGDLTVESAGADGTSQLTDIPDPQGFQARIYAARDLRKHRIHGTAPQATAQTHGRTSDRWDRVERLAALRSQGLLSAAEFARAKAEILGDTSSNGPHDVQPTRVLDRSAVLDTGA